jgi:outer membrane protein OmpA-like peptidoglycan-associated protein
MTRPSSISQFLILIVLLSMLTSVDVRTAGVPQFSVRFEAGGVKLSGRVDSEETAAAILKVIAGTRPDLQVINEGLTVDPSVEFPNLSDVNSLLMEIGLSTVDGRLEIWKDRLFVSGLSDSLVTLTALKIRAEPILHGRAFFSRVCIVPTEDLPRISNSPAENSLTGTGLDPDFLSPAQASFEVPGILLEKLFPTLVMLSSFDRLEGKTSAPAQLTAPAPAATPLRAIPMEMTESTPAPGAPPASGIMAVLAPAAPVPQIETLPSIHFSTNSFLPRANQNEILDQISKHLLSADRIGFPVRVEAVKTSGGAGAFGDYLSERRSSEVVRFLTERGVAPSVFSVGSVTLNSPVDDGEVRLQVEIPPPPPVPEPVVIGSDGEGSVVPANPPPSPGNPGETTPTELSTQ